MKEQSEVSIHITEAGEQTVMEHPVGSKMGVVVPGDAVKVDLLVGSESVDVGKLQRLAVTNEIPTVMLKNIEKQATE